jgi:hypothetical protein
MSSGMKHEILALDGALRHRKHSSTLGARSI